MPPSRSDARALVFAVGSLVIAGVVVAVFLFWGTRGVTPSLEVEGDHRFPVGDASTQTRSLTEGGPVYLANPFGGDGFWLALEDGSIVALAVQLPGTDECTVKWRGRNDTFEDCDGRSIMTTDLDRYDVEIPTDGDHEGQVIVDLSVIEPAPSGRA